MDTKGNTRRTYGFRKLVVAATLLLASAAIASPAATSAAGAHTHQQRHAGPGTACTIFFCPPPYLQ